MLSSLLSLTGFVYRRYRLYLYKHMPGSIAEPVDCTGCTFTTVTDPGDVTPKAWALIKGYSGAIRAGYQMWRLRNGTACLYILCQDGNEACLVFVSNEPWDDRRFFGIRDARWAIDGPGITDPDFRGRGLYTKALCHVVEMLHRQGVDDIYSSIDTWNTASMRAHEKAGYVKVGEYYAERWFTFFIRSRKIA